jgi:hypothetical protein
VGSLKDGRRVEGLCVGRCVFGGVVGRGFGGVKSRLERRNLVMLFLEVVSLLRSRETRWSPKLGHFRGRGEYDEGKDSEEGGGPGEDEGVVCRSSYSP